MRTNFNMEDQYITMVKGDTLAFALEIEDQDGNPLDVETAYFTCKKNYNDDSNTFQKSLGNGITRASAGKYLVRVAPADTRTKEAGKYFYDFQVSKNNDTFTFMRGVLELEQDVTN